MIKTIFPLLVIISLVSCATVSISPIRNENQSTQVTRGVESLIANDDILSCTIVGTTDNNYAVFTVSLVNKTDRTLYFDENDISLDIGQYEKQQWKFGEIYTASKFYKAAQQNARTSEILMAIAAGLSAVSAGWSTSSFSGTVSGYSDYGSFYSGSYSGQISTYDPAAAQYQIAQAQSNLASVITSNKNYLESLKKTLLFSSQIPPKSIYTGIVFAPLQNEPDMRININVGESKNSFIFRRSDFKEIINPFIAYNRNKGYLAATYSTSNKIGGEIGWLGNKKIGLYTSWIFTSPDFGDYTQSYYSYYPDGSVEHPIWDEYRYTNKATEKSVDGIIGANFRILPYLWISAGGGIFYRNEYHLYEELFNWYDGTQTTEGFSWAGQVDPTFKGVVECGLTTGFGPIFISGKYHYIIGGDNSVIAAIGITF